MFYASQARIRPSADRRRLAVLLRRLEAIGCDARVDEDEGTLELMVPFGETSWSRTGNATALLMSYSDVVMMPLPWGLAERTPAPRALPEEPGESTLLA